MKLLGVAFLTLVSAAVGAATVLYAIRKREELECYDFDFDDDFDDEIYFEECDCDGCGGKKFDEDKFGDGKVEINRTDDDAEKDETFEE